MAKHELILEDNFPPLYGDIIVIPAWTVFWRGYDPSYPIVSSRPAYYSNREIANGYANPAKGLELGAFCTSQNLNVIDIRFLKVILKQLFEESRVKFTTQDKNTLFCVQTSFGLCSLRHQIELMKQIYGTNSQIPGLVSMESVYKSNKILEQPGVRIAETNIDGFTMYFLKGLFENLTKCRIDGFISPRLVSPFHIEKPSMSMNPELILFNPTNVNIRQVDITKANLSKITVTSILYTKHHSILTFNYGHFGTSLYMHGGGQSQEPAIELFNRKLDKKDKEANKICRKARIAGLRWSSMMPNLTWIEPPARSITKLKLELNDVN